MVRSGLVIMLNRADNTGIIQDARKREFFFSIHECVENELPKLYSTVTFVKDADYKSTDVAALIKQSEVFKAIA
jgi:hypothetical protein